MLEYEKYVPEQRYFRKLNTNDVAMRSIHLVVYDTPWWKRHIQFRDHLRRRPEIAQEYAELKKNIK